ncbi:hypothetical protein EDE08_10813 [Bradyrhizobium sp. R2.2-H]|jgi:hypothetical protein|uniref:hypothetical protein n=1 Tax=unclassified Bradyrhizobium TaxID=2631580 RepID=UPI0010D8670B|nr:MULTISPECIES: hypothetical protein [unclassified Bradyrhizobium]TCU69268.1 hypothetical protein EDE10_10813 [Bradyrhizobium sp. Y-H1]TCU70760.1 hypothetical protein EDE08_10813 [Bradyrhizobium sp. R2.2-H]
MEKAELHPEDFPLMLDGDALVTQDGTKVANARSVRLAEDIAQRLNENAARKREDRWAL